MRAIRGAILFFLVLLPLVTLFHRDDLGHWTRQTSAMAGPDEFSYLLMARHFLEGGGVSLREQLGRDTYFPPGYPLLIATWTKCFFSGKLTAFSAHTLNTALLCADVFLCYLFSCRFLKLLFSTGHRRFAISAEGSRWIALLITGIFAANWHVLETSLLIMSEPAFMLVTFAWLILALAWPRWNQSLAKTGALTLLATAAWSIRGAGIVAVVCTAGFAVFMLLCNLKSRRRISISAVAALAMALALALPAIYQISLTHFSPEKSIASGEESANSYPRQLMHGLTARLAPQPPLQFSRPEDYPGIAGNLAGLILAHFNDYASSFVPWPRENPDFHFRDILGKIFGFFGFAGWLLHASRYFPVEPGKGGTQAGTDSAESKRPALDVYVWIYICLYLIWPFDFARFWSPILPAMLACGASLVVTAWPTSRSLPRALVPGVLLGLLFILSAGEIWHQLGNYARRLNYVSDSLADGVRAVIRASPDPQRTVIAGQGADERFALAWYVGAVAPGAGFEITSPAAHLPEAGGRGENTDEMLLRRAAGQPRGSRLFLFAYFPNTDTQAAIAGFLKRAGGDATVTQFFRKEIIVTIWEIRGGPPEPPDAMPGTSR